jgi:hypothetical protein
MPKLAFMGHSDKVRSAMLSKLGGTGGNLIAGFALLAVAADAFRPPSKIFLLRKF